MSEKDRYKPDIIFVFQIGTDIQRANFYKHLGYIIRLNIECKQIAKDNNILSLD